jgi:ABC-type sugar transport system ATPase subunit
MRERFLAIAERLGVAIRPEARAGSLSVADQQMIEIMRALVADHRVLVMDEPTAALGPAERRKLFDVIADLRRSGCSIIYISHDLDEVLRLADRVSVMRAGALIETAATASWTKARLVASMVGEVRAPTPRLHGASRAPDLIRVEGLKVPGRVSDVTLTLHQGEVLGLAGLVGSGRTEILRSIAGADPTATGRIVLDGATAPLFRSVRGAVDAGIMLVPEDRKGQGIVPLLSGDENVVLTDLRSVSRWGLVQSAKQRDRAEAVTIPLGFAPARLRPPIGTLSGGNQQKLVIGKCLHREPRILLLDEPTRGIDIGAKAEIFAAIQSLAARGMGVILVSSELEEVVAHSDRVVVLAQGRLIAELNGAEASVDNILGRIFAVEQQAGHGER